MTLHKEKALGFGPAAMRKTGRTAKGAIAAKYTHRSLTGKPEYLIDLSSPNIFIKPNMLRYLLPLFLISLCTGCGLKGNLYLPEKSAPVIIAPAASSAESSSASSSSAQATP